MAPGTILLTSTAPTVRLITRTGIIRDTAPPVVTVPSLLRITVLRAPPGMGNMQGNRITSFLCPVIMPGILTPVTIPATTQAVPVGLPALLPG